MDEREASADDAVVREEIRRTLIEELQTLVSETGAAARALRALGRAAKLRTAVWSVGIATLSSALALSMSVAAARVLLPSPREIAALTAQLYLSGGAVNPFVSLFLLQVILGAVLLPTTYVWALAGLAA